MSKANSSRAITRSPKPRTRTTLGESGVAKSKKSQRQRDQPVIIKVEPGDDVDIKQEIFCSQESIQGPTPPSSPKPTCDYKSPNYPVITAVSKRSDKVESKYTGSIPCQNQNLGACDQKLRSGESTCTEIDQTQKPTVNWDCVSYVVSDQKVHTSYEKPEMSPSQVDPNGNPIPSTSRVQAYGKMVTKTVTMTITTTIATTEILRPGEAGYPESLERQRRQKEQGPEERLKQERLYHESRKLATGDRTSHENYHFTHHKTAQPAPSCMAA